MKCILLATLLGTACAERPLKSDRAADSAMSATRAERRRAFLTQQEAETRGLLRGRSLKSEVVLVEPTVIAFYPEVEAGPDTGSPSEAEDRYRPVAEAGGWAFQERYSGELRLTDPGSQALYFLRVSRDSAGLVLGAPGYPPRVWYGLVEPETLREKLEALRAWLPGGAARRPERL